MPPRRPPSPRRRLPPEVLSDAEVRALIAACGPGLAGARNAALIALLYRSGLRIAEALALQPKDLDLDAGVVRVLAGKGGRWRVVGIDAGAAAYLAAWANRRARAGVPSGVAFFCTAQGRPLSTSYVRVLLPRLRARAGIAKRVHAHGLRHTHAAQLRAEGVDILIISRQLGHRSLLTTIHYLNHIAPTDVIKAIRERRWGEGRGAGEAM